MISQIKQNLLELEQWNTNCELNFGHKYYLVNAELLSLEGGDPKLAKQSYAKALELATKNGFTHHAAIVSELFARFYLNRGKIEKATKLKRACVEGYVHWGATAVAVRVANTLLPSHSSLLNGCDVDIQAIMHFISKFGKMQKMHDFLTSSMEEICKYTRASYGVMLIKEADEKLYVRARWCGDTQQTSLIHAALPEAVGQAKVLQCSSRVARYCVS